MLLITEKAAPSNNTLENIEKVLSNSMSSVGASNFIRNGAIAYIPANSTATEIVSLTQQAQLSFSVPEKELKNASTLKISIDGIGPKNQFNSFGCSIKWANNE